MARTKRCGNKKRKRLPSINPFLHFLKRLWKDHKGCKRSAVLKMAVQKWECMSRAEKEPFYEAACRAQRLHRKLRKCGKKRPKCSKPKRRCPKAHARRQTCKPKHQSSCPSNPQASGEKC
ncbi:UNVERIFIED_CONTAM: hypothetical protein PYX00_007038 [Menopon gallinae]|uniref:Protamine n=1 Tax=Menopon gallinae TaxID=328185 RepID=A0AAW2HH57_9NEOP